MYRNVSDESKRSKCFEVSENATAWAGMILFLTNRNLSIMRTGFLPFIPHPVTNYSTVCTTMNNFTNIIKQLDQYASPLSCDEGIYKKTDDIVLNMSRKL